MRTSIIIAFALVLSLSLQVLSLLPTFAADIYSDGFESGDFVGGGWVTSGSPAVVSTQAHHGTYSARFQHWSHCNNLLLPNSEPQVYLGAQVYFEPFTAFADWKQDYLHIRNSTQNLMAIAGIQGGGGNWRYKLSWYNMSSYSHVDYDSSVEATTETWHWMVLGYSSGPSYVNLTLYVDDVLVASMNVDTDQTYVADGIGIGGQQFGGFSSYDYIDCVFYSTTYPSDPYGDTRAPEFGGVSTNTNIAGSTCTFNCLINDDSNVSAYVFSTNNTGVWTNDAAVKFSIHSNETAAWANVTKTLNGTVGNVVSYKWYANDTSNNWGHSDQYNLTTSAMHYYGYTPGFWKNHPEKWPEGRNPGDRLTSVFGVGALDVTLAEALSLKGGSRLTGAKRILAHHAVAALLNSETFGDGYPYTAEQLKRDVSYLFCHGTREAMIDFADDLDYWNNVGLPPD